MLGESFNWSKTKMAEVNYAALSTQPSGSITKMRAEQIKSEDGFASLAVDFEALRGQVKDIIGAADYKEAITGEYAKVQIVDLAAHLDASGATSLSVKQDVAVAGSGSILGTLNVDGQATLASVNVEDLTSGRVVFAGASGELTDASGLTWDGSDLVAASAKVSDLTSGRVVYAGTSGALVDNANLAFDGTDLTMASAKVSDLTATRVVYVGASGALVDSGEMTFGAGGLTLSKDISARSGSFSGDITIAGNLTVQGATTTVDTQNLQVADAKIVISSGGIVDGAGLYLGDDTAGENIRWETDDGGKWIASDKFAADTIQALDLSEAIVWADASGNLVEISNQQLADAIEARLVGGVGVTITEAGSFVTASIGQPVGTADSVTFAGITNSSLSASRLMATNGSKAEVSVANLADWVAGTANRVSVTNDGDGTITLSGPQDIHTGASPTFVGETLSGLAADAGKAMKVGPSGALSAAVWDEFVAIEANKGLSLSQSGFKAQVGLAQDIRTTASPQFNALNVGTAHDILQVNAGADFKFQTTGKIILQDAEGTYELANTGEYASFNANFTATSIVGALNEIAEGLGGGKGKEVQTMAGDVSSSGGAFPFQVVLTTLDLGVLDNDAAAQSRLDVYVNGMMMVQGSDYSVNRGADRLDFAFPVKQGDVVVAVIR